MVIDLLPLQKDFFENEDVDDLTNDCREYHPYVNPSPNVKTFDEMDEFMFTLTDFNKLGYKSDHFILVSQAKQTFYVQDQLNPKWSIVISPH